MPAVAIVTEQFRSGAMSQGQSLGFDPAVIYVEHPIQDRTEAEMAEIARGALDAVVEALQAA